MSLHSICVTGSALQYLCDGQCLADVFTGRRQTTACPRQAWGDVVTPGADSSGEVRLIPNPDTLQRVPWFRQHGITLADLVWKPLPQKEVRTAGGELPAGPPPRAWLGLL